MVARTKTSEIDCEEELKSLENLITDKAYLSLTEVGELLGRKPSVISQYAQSGLVHLIQQGPRKIMLMRDVYLMEVYLYLVKYYGYSYTACKIVGQLLRDSDRDPCEYMEYIKEIEQKLEITEKEKSKYVRSYTSRGLVQKQKAKESRGDFQISYTSTEKH